MGVPQLLKNKTYIKKQINILDPNYLSQIKSYLHETVRETFCGCPMMKTNNQTHKQTWSKLDGKGHQFSTGARRRDAYCVPNFNYTSQRAQRALLAGQRSPALHRSKKEGHVAPLNFYSMNITVWVKIFDIYCLLKKFLRLHYYHNFTSDTLHPSIESIRYNH